MEEEEESSDDSAKSLAKKQTLPSLWNRALRFGKTAVIAGAAVVTAPVVIPQAVVGFAFSVPFGVYFAGLVYTENVMRALFLSNCQCEIVENQDVQIVLQDKDTSPTSLYYLNANLEEVEIKHTSEDDINEKYYDGGTYENTNVVLRVVQENENNLTSDERNGDDICIFMQSSRDDKCDSELPLCSNNTECGDMILPVHLEEEALDEAGRRDLENQQASKNVNDQNSDAEIYYEEQEKLSELQQQGCGSGIEALGLNEALHKLEERSIDEGGDIIEDVHSFNVIEPIAETKEIVTRKEDESMNEGMDFSKRNYNAETYDEEKTNLSDLQKHGCGLGTEALGLNEALHKLEERSIGNEDDIGKDVGHSFVIDPTTEMKDKVTIKDNESSHEEDSDERDSNVETYNEQKNKLSTLRHGCGLRIEELGLNEALRDMEVGVIAEDGTNECDNSPFIIQEPLVENEERDISNDDKSMNEDIKLDDQDLDSIALTDDPGKEECTLENEALHKMEDSVIAEKDRTNECNNPPFIVLDSPVEKEEKYISNNDKSVNNAMKLNDQELDSLDLKDDPEIEECALGNDGKLKDEVDGEAIETTVLGNVSTGEAESEHGFVHVFGGDNSHSETNQSTVNELNKLGTEPPMLDEQTHVNGENVIEENERRIESYAFPDQPLDGNTGTTTSYKPNDQIGDELLYNPAHFDKVTDEVEHERDDTSAEMDMEHHTMLQPNPNEEENDLEKDEIGEGCLLKLENDDAGQTDYIELKNDTIMETGKEEEEDIEVCTEMSDEHTEETGTDAALQTAYIELTDDMNWDTSKEEEETPPLASIETEDEMNGNIENNEETDVDMERKIDELYWDASKDEEETPVLSSVKLEDEMKGNIEDNEVTDVNMVRKIDELNWDTSKQEEETSLLASIITEDEMKGNMEDNVETNVSLDRKIEHLDNMFDLTNAMDDNLILKDMDNKVKVWEETSEDQPKTSYLYAAVMPKEVESEIVDHKTEKGTVDVKQELTGDESFMAKDDNPLEELPTVPEEREISFEFPNSSSEMTMENQPKTDLLAQLNIDGSYKVKDDESVGDLPTVPEEQEINFEVPCSSSNQTLSTNLNRTGEKVEDSSEGEIDVLGDETKDVTVVETKETLAPMEYENENVESSISIDHAFDIENRSSDITSAESRVEVTLVDGSELVHFHDEVIYGEDAIWEQIEALRTIIGCKAEIHPSLTDELKGLYLLIGVEPPASLDETSDLIEVTDKLEFLKTVIGVK